MKHNTDKTKKKDVSVKNFETYCEQLGVKMQVVGTNVDTLFDNFNNLKQTFNKKFKGYMTIADSYKKFVKAHSDTWHKYSI